MENQDNHRYDDIINLPNPTSKKHPRMSLYDRAAQFSPFAALTGHEAAIKETARQTDEKLMLSDEVIAELNEKLNLIAETIGTQQRVRITYFVHLTAMDMTMKCHHSSIKNLPLCLTTRLKEQRKKGLPCRPQRAGRSNVFSAGKAAFRKKRALRKPSKRKIKCCGCRG